jgi:ligand-binding sensor domain-containing protein
MFKFISLIIFFTAAVRSQTFENFNESNSGLPNNNVKSISIIGNTLWLATEGGLSAFDGAEWSTYGTEDGLSSVSISNSLEYESDEISGLVIATPNGADDFMVSSNDIIDPIVQYDTEIGIISNNVLSLGIDKLNSRWLGTEYGLSIVLDHDSVINLQSTVGSIKLNNDFINSIAISVDTVRHKTEQYNPQSGVIYTATNGGGVSRFYFHEVDGISSASVVEKMWSGLPSDTVLTVYIDDKNNHWYGTTRGAAVHKEHDSKNADWRVYTVNSGLINNNVTAIISDSSGNIWFGTKGGISKYDGNNWESFTVSSGLASNNVHDINIDASGNIWIATDNGITKLSGLPSAVKDNTPINKFAELKIDAYPNPFNSEIRIRFYSSVNQAIDIEIFNSLGESVRKFGAVSANNDHFELIWNGQNNQSSAVNSGIYFISARNSSSAAVKKILLLK